MIIGTGTVYNPINFEQNDIKMLCEMQHACACSLPTSR